MANAPHDQNDVVAKLGTYYLDGVTMIPITINPVNGAMRMNTSNVVAPEIIALFSNRGVNRDENHNPGWMGAATDDGRALPIFVDLDGAVLVDL